MSGVLICWNCGSALTEYPLPISRTAECNQCHADLHVCKLCLYYDLSISNSCQEPIADEVLDKQKANFCDYFKTKPNAFNPTNRDKQNAARHALESLFNNPTTSENDHQLSQNSDPTRSELENLFKK